jgi:hypothetical protein
VKGRVSAATMKVASTSAARPGGSHQIHGWLWRHAGRNARITTAAQTVMATTMAQRL